MSPKVSAGPLTLQQRINYGIFFVPKGHLHLGQEVWRHTYQVQLPKGLDLPSQVKCRAKHCFKRKHILNSLNSLRVQCLASVNETIHQISQLVPHHHVNTQKPFPHSFIANSRSKRGIFDFIGDISSSLFGTATSSFETSHECNE